MKDLDTFRRDLELAARDMSVEVGAQDTMDAVVQLAPVIIPGCDQAGVSIVRPDGMDTPSATSAALRHADELQYSIDEGPCRDALRDEQPVSSDDVAIDARWPRWGPHLVEEIGLRSVMSFRLFVAAETLGVLSVYGRQRSAFDTDSLDEGTTLAALVAVALAAEQRAENLHRALDTRTLIGQATGMLIERFGLAPAQAFALLTRLSQQQNLKIRVLAEQVVLTGYTRGLPQDRQVAEG